jgi:TnpA family transposase
MARRRLLGDDAWARLLDPPTDELEIARLCTLTTDDLALIGNRRTDATRLGYALVLLYLRHPGRVLEIGEVPPDALLVYVAGQLGAPAAAFADYAARDTTRREHLAELMTAGGHTVFSRPLAHEMVSSLAAAAQTIVQPGQLAGILVEELRRRRVLLPSPLVLEAVIRHAR